MALVVARTRKEDGAKLYWDGIREWWPEIERGVRFQTEAAAKEIVERWKTLKETRGLNPDETLGYEYITIDDTTVLAGGPSGNVFIKNYVPVKDTTPNGYANPE